MDEGPDACITAYSGGPLLVRGDYVVNDGSGKQLPRRRVVALCCCGRSAIKPWCDGSHKDLGLAE